MFGAKPYSPLAVDETPLTRPTKRSGMRYWCSAFMLVALIGLIWTFSSTTTQNIQRDIPDEERLDEIADIEGELGEDESYFDDNLQSTAEELNRTSLNGRPEDKLAEDAAEQQAEEQAENQVHDLETQLNDDPLAFADNEEDTVNEPQVNITSTTAFTSPYTSGQLEQMCPLWSAEFAKRYEKTCGYWMRNFADWESQVVGGGRREVAYQCNDQKECHGWGDRIAGMESAFFKAMDLGLPFKIGHDYLNSLFAPCLLGRTKREANWTNYGFHAQPQACASTHSGRCNAWLAKSCGSKTQAVTVNSDRVCIPRHHCAALYDYNKNLSAAQTLGCVSRALLEPSVDFYMKQTFPFKVDGNTTMMTLKAIQNFLSKHFVIAVQMRLGDLAAFKSRKSSYGPGELKKYLRPFRCAASVESHLARASGEYEAETTGEQQLTIKGKRVLWYLATDTYSYKVLADHSYGTKLVSFDFRPEHIGLTGKGKSDLAKEIAEWYVLGLADKLIVNKIGLDASDIFHGRVSGYAKTAWIYHLKHMVYDAGTCQRYSIPYEGTWEDMRAKGCGYSSLYYGRTKFSQNHLLPLLQANVSFPGHFVLQGKVVRDDGVTRD